MKTEVIEKLKTTRSTASGLRGFFAAYKKKTSEPSCDKYDASFNSDDRFCVFSRKIFFSSYAGYYGNSGCSTFGAGINPDIAGDAFVRWLNANKDHVFSGMAEIIEKDARDLADKAQQELDKLQSLIDSAKAGDEKP